MAIVEMKRISLLAMKADREKLMTAMQRMGCVQVTDVPDDVRDMKAKGDEALGTLNARLVRLEWALDRLKKYDTAGKVMFGCVPEVTQSEADAVLDDEQRYFDFVAKLESFERCLGEMRGDEARTMAALAQLESWTTFDLKKNELQSGNTVRVYTGVVQTRALDELRVQLSALPATLEAVGIARENTCVCVIAHISAARETEAALTKAGFAPETFAALLPDETPAMAIERLSDEQAQIDEKRISIENETKEIAKNLPQMKVLHDEMAIKAARLSTMKRAAETESTFLMTGWVPARLADKLEEKLKKLSPSCSLELRAPNDDEEPPVELENSRFATPFESVVEGFALPAYRAYDPTAIMAPFYACLFGMMVSDAGYGLIMAIAIPLFIKFKKIKFENAKMMYLLTWGGLATVIWGLIYNTVMGFNPLPANLWLLDPVSNSLPVMGVCLAVGALHLFTGLGIAAYMNFKRGDPVAAISDQFSWMLLLSGLGMLLLPATAQVGKIFAIVGAGIILLMAGRERKNPFKRLIKGLSSLYGITSWVSDLLSYMRLFGMGLATGVIGMVFNQLISMVWNAGIVAKPFAVILFIACHGFNLAINVLGAYVHSCRLQYIEFFGKFYEEGGKPFKPLSTRTRYVSIKQDAA